MPIDNTKLKQLYDTLKQGGYKKDYNNFRTKFLGNENYPYRQKVFNLLSENGEDYGSSYGEFMQRMQVAKPTAAASAAPKQPQQIDTLSTIQSARDTIFNPKAAVQPGGKVAQQAVKDEQTQDDAATKPFDVNQANAFVENMRLQNEAAQRQHQNVNDYLQHTAGQFGKNATQLGFKGQSNLGLPLAAKNQDGAFIDALGREYESETEARLAQTGAQHAREALTEANMQHNDPKNYLLEQKARIEKELNARSSQLERATDRIPSFATGVAGNAMTQAAARLTDKLQDTKYKALTMQLDKVNQALDTLDEAEHAKASDQWIADSSNWIERAGKNVLSFGAATGRSFKRQASKLSNWDFGFSDLAGGLAIFDAVDKADKGGVEALSPEQRKMLDLYAYNNHIQGENKEHLGWGNTAGTVTAQALPFMLEMALNPASGVGKFAQRKAMQWAVKKYGKEKLKQIAKRYLLAKAGTRIAGDWLGAATMSATTGQARVAADAVQRRIGEVETDIDNFGRVTYGGHKNGVDWGEAFGKAFLSNTIENQTEMAGDYFGIIGKAFSKGGQKALDKIGLGFVNDFMRNVSSTKVAKAVTDFENATHWNGTTGEYLEEVLGNVENALMVGDSTFDTDKDTGVFNVDKNIETFLSVAVMGGFFSAVKTASYTAPKKRALNEMADIGRQIDGMLGNNNAALEQWGTWRNTFINGTDEEKKQTLREVMDNQQLPMGFRMAFLEYTKAAQKYHGIAQAEQKRAEEGTLDPIGQALDQAFEEGYGTTEPTDRQMAYRRLNETRAQVAQLLELEEGEDVDEAMGNDPIGYIHTLEEQGFTPEQIQPVLDYANAQATYEGMMQQREDRANEQADAVKREVRQITHRQNGQIQKATLDGEREVYILNGKVVLYPDGTGVDKQESDDVLYVQDVQTGELFTIAPNRISELAEPTDPQAVIAEREEAIAAATNQEIEQEEGAASGTVAPEPTTVPEMAGVDAQQGGVSATQQQQTAPTYESGSRFTLDLPNGSSVNGVVLQETDDGVEVQTDSPVNGRFVQVFPTDEFDGMLSSVRDEADDVIWSREVAGPVDVEEENQNDAAANGQQTETKNEKPTLSDVIATLYEKGKEYASSLFGMKFFDVAQTPQFMKDLGIRGSKFTIRYGVISRHWGKDNEHTLPREVWEQLPKAIQHPFAITKYYSDNEKKKQKGYRVYTSLQLSNGSFVVVSVEVKNAGRNIEVNAINTIFGRERISDVHDELIYTSETITPEQMALLNENNPHQYPSERESSESKDTSSSRSLQGNEGENAANGQQREMQGNGIPVDAKTGEPVYEAVAPDVAWDAIVQEAEGDEAMAMQVVTDMVADMEAKVQKAKKAKVRAGSSVREKLEAQKKHKRRIEEAEAQLEAWRRIAAVKAERIAAAERAKIEAAQQREVTQDDETEVPDFVFDKPENARERGYRMQNGQRADRQEPIAAAVGKEVSVKFTNKVSQPVRVAVVDARSLQPSHQNGQPNVLHFLPEAQPKKRTDHESVHAAEQMAAQMNPEEITSSVTAYTGAPSVNARGEVIQGNNRTAALKRMWQGYPEQAAAYKQYLMDHASEYGLNPEDIAAMEQPVLVNLMDVTDEQAIELGQYDVKDTESGGTERIKPRNVSQKMGDKAERFASILLRTTDEDASVSQLIDEHAVETLKWLEAQHYISPTQYRSAFNAEGEVTTEAKNDLRGILYQAVFKNGSERLEDMFNALPAKAQRAILATAYRDFATPESEKMLPEIQNSIVAFYELSQDAAFANAKNFEEARKATMAWLQQMQFDFSTGQSVSREGKYTNFALTLAAMYKVQTQTAIQQTFNDMFDLLQGRQQPDLYNPNPNNTPRTLAEAIREVLNIEYDGTNGSHALGGNNETRTTGRQGSARDDSAGGTDAPGNAAADAEGGTGSDAVDGEARENAETEPFSEDTVGGSPVALAYLLEGGVGSILNAGYFLHGVAAAYPKITNIIERIRASHKEVLGLPPLEFVEKHPDIVAEIEKEIQAAYGQKGVEIYRKLCQNASGFYPRQGFEVEREIEALESAENDRQVENKENKRKSAQTQNVPLKPIGKGLFGNIYDQFKGKVQEAFDFLLKHKSGDLLGVFHRKGVGDIDLIWGDNHAGLAHIINKHIGNGKSFSNMKEFIESITDIINNGNIDFENGDKIVFKKGSKLVTIRTNIRNKGKKIADKNWILTAYDELSADGDVSAIAPINKGQAARTTGKSNSKDTPENRAVQTSGQENAETSLQSEVTRAEQQTNAEPTEGQKEAGNYKKGRVKVGPFDVVIEQPRGSVRSGVDANGKAWETTMQNTYGYFGGTKGVDGDAIDVFLGNDLDGWDGTTVFVVDQYNPDGSFDEHKVMLGFNSQEEAEAAYFANYESDWAKTHRTEVTAVPLADFTEWVKSSKRKTKAFAEYKVAKRNSELDAHNAQNEQLAEQLFSMAKEAETEKDFFDRAASLFEVTGYESDLRDIYNGVKSGEIANARALSFYTNATLKPVKVGVKAGVKVKAPKSEQKQKAEAPRQSGYERKHWHADSSLEEMLAREKYLQNAMSFGTKEMAEVFPMAEEWQRDREELKAKYGNDLKNALPNDVKKAFLKKHKNTFANQTALNDELYELRSAIISHKEKAASRAEAAAKEQKAEEANKRFGDFLNGKTPLRRASIVKALTRVSNFGKEGSMTMAQFIEKHVAEGTLELRTKEVDKLQGPSRRQLNRMDASQQAQAENRVKQAGKKTEYLINGFVANKTAYEYAEHLLATKNSKAGEKARKHAAQPGAPAVSTQEATLRDALVDVAQQSGLEVVVDEKAQQVLDEVNGRARTMAFGEEYDYDRYPEGRVEPNIADKYVHIERAKLDHGFANFNEAKEWAKSHIVRTLDNEESGGKGNVKISSTAVNKYLSESAVAKSDSKDVHLAVLKKLPEIIHDSVDVETTPDFKKDENGVRKVGNEINKNVLIHRCYGAVEINGNIYRVKITLKEYKDKNEANKAYSYEATKIELFAGTLANDRKTTTDPGTNNSISVAKLLKDVEMSYRPGVKVLEESAKQRARLREHRVFHGSGAEFDAFDHSHMGEGEGAQAYGWGTYVTEVEGIGRAYARNPWQMKINELESNISRAKEKLPFMPPSATKTELENNIKEWEEELAKLENGNKHLYTVEIPEDNGTNYLHWEKPLTREQIGRITEKLKSGGWNVVDGNHPTFEKNGERIVLNERAQGQDVYAELEEALGSDKVASEFLASIGFTGISYPAEALSGGRKDAARNFVIFNEKDAQITDHIRFFRTPSGEAYGFTVDGKIYLDPRIATAETPIHEYAHLWADMIRNVNAEAWNDIVGLMKATPIWEEVRGLYPELKTDDEIADEVLAHYSGRRGAERLREAQQHAAAETGKSVFERAAAVAAIERVKQALAKFWQSVAELFHIRFTSAEEVADRVLADMLNGVNPNKVRNSSSVNVAEFAAKHHLNQNDVKKYADSMRSGSLGGASYAFKSIKRSVLLANEGLSLGQFTKVFKPIKNELFSNFGNVEELREEHVQEALNNRNVMEAARKREEAEKEAERKRLEVFEQMSDEALDKAYMEAVRNNDEQRMRDLVNEAARRKGYQSTDEFRMSHRAPSYDEDGTDKSLIDVANNKDNIRDSLEEQFRMNRDRNREESVAAIRQALQEIEQGKNPTVTIYRAVPKSLKEGSVRNGDWVTLSEAYAKQHGRHALNGDYRIMKENVPAANLYWDGNDINEWGYDDKRDYKYKDTRNNRKLNDPMAQMMGKPRGTKKQRAQFAERERGRMQAHAEKLVERLHLTNVEIVTDASQLEGKQRTAKGFYNKRTGKITIVLPNHASTADVEQTLLHEAVAHYGLRQLFGEHFDDFLDMVYRNAEEGIRRKIAEASAKHGWNVRTATEEYLADLAERTDFEHASPQWWAKIKGFFLDMLRGLGFEAMDGQTLTDNELRYVLWRSYENLTEPGKYPTFIAEARDVAKQHALQVGRFAPTETAGSRVAENEALSEEETAEILFRDGNDYQYTQALARDRYERRIKSGMYQTQEALQDSMLGLRTAMESILEAEGRKGVYIEDIDGFENAYLGENRLSSVNQAEAEKFSREVFAPMLEEVSKLAPTADERAKLIDYLFAKHGLERNEVMARRAAAKEARKEFEKELRTAARAVSKDPLDQDAEDALDDVKQRMQEREDALYSENRQKTDYAGLTTLTGKAAVADAELMAHDMVDTYENAHDTNALWDAINTVTQRTLKKSFDTGMISRDTYDDIRSMYQFYIPLRGFDERTSNEEYAYLGGTESVFTSPIKTAKGRRSKADDPLAYMQMMAESAIAQGNRNQLVKQKLLNFALNHPSDLISVSELWLRRDPVTDQWSVVQPGDLPGTDKLEDSDTAEMVSQKMEQFEQVMQQLALQNPDDFVRQKDRPDIPYRVVNAREMQQHQVMVKRNGKTYVLTINGNPRAAQAVNGLTNPNNDMSGAIGVMARSVESANRWLSSVYTTRNPDFVLTNLARDAGYTNTMVWLKEDSSYAVNFNRNYATRANLLNMIRLYSRLMNGKLDLTDPTEMLFSQFISNGGETGYTAMRDLDAHKTKIKKELKKLSSDPSVRKVWNASFDMLDLFNKAAENSARFAAFITSREAGRTLDRSIYDAKEISVNFNKKGAGAKFLDSYGAQVKNDIRDLSWKNPNLLKLTKDVAIYQTVFSSGVGRSFFAFWNAAIQGSTNFGRVVKRHPKKALTAMAIMFALGLANAMVGASGDDDDDAEEGNGYFDHPSNTRRSNLMLRINGKSWASIPLPVEYRAVYGMGELLGSVMSGKERYTNQELAHEVLCQVSQVLPLDVVGEGSGAFVPTFAKPAFEVLTNESWTGLPIYKQTVYNERDPAYTKAYSNTNKQLVGMSKMLNELSGGDSQKSGWLDVNPSVIEHLGRGYLGGYFNLVDKLVKTGETVVGSREYDPSNLLIVNRFVKSGSERTAYRAINNRYYQIKADSEDLIKDYKGYNYETETGKRDYSQKIAQMKDSPELLSAMAAHEYITEVDKYNKALKSEQDEVLKKRMEKELYELKSAMIHTVDSILDQKQTLRKAE